MFGKTWLWFYYVTVFIILLSYILGLFLFTSVKPNYFILIIYLPGTIILIFLKKTYIKKIEPFFKAFNLNLTKNYDVFKHKELIYKLQNIILKEYLHSNTSLITSKQIREIIKALKYDSSGTDYVYQSLKTSISLLSIITAAFFGSWFGTGANFSGSLQIVIKSLIALVIIAFFFYFIEYSFIKDFVLNKRNKHKRLIRLLENYNLNNFKEG